MLYRAGYPDLGDVVEHYMSSRPSLAKEFSVENLIDLPRDKFSTIGVTRHGDVKELERFKDWYSTTPLDKRNQLLSLINYYQSPEDERDILQCIKDSEYTIRTRLTKAYRNSVSRIQTICNKILQSKYPITKAQLESFLDLYSGKPGLAQVCDVYE